MLKKGLIVLVCLLHFLTNSATTVTVVRAEVISCTATIAPTSMLPSTLYNLNFAVTNTSEDPIVWVRITRPSANFSLDSAGGDWDVDGAAESYTFHNGTLLASQTHEFSIQSTAAATELAAQNWLVEASTSPDGSAAVSCPGTLGVSISGSAAPSEIAPAIIANLVATNITATTATITWNTNKSTNAQVDYGLTDSYGLAALDFVPTTNHSVTLAGLSPQTNYFYQVKVTDSLENVSLSEGFSFTTTPTSAPLTTIVTVTVTPTPTPTPTQTPTNQTNRSASNDSVAAAVVSATAPNVVPTTTPTSSPQVLGLQTFAQEEGSADNTLEAAPEETTEPPAKPLVKRSNYKPYLYSFLTFLGVLALGSPVVFFVKKKYN